MAFNEQDFIYSQQQYLGNKEFAPQEYNKFRGLTEKQFPGLFYVIDIESLGIKHLGPEGCTLFGRDLADIQQTGDQFLIQVIHPDDIERCYSLIMDLINRGIDGEMVTFFHRIKLRPDHEDFMLVLSSVKLDIENRCLIGVSNLTEQLHLFTTKVSQVLNENKEVKLMAKRYLQLTKREQEIIPYLAKGYAVKKLANELHVSPRTIEQHKKNIYKKLEINKLSELIHLAYQLRIIKNTKKGD